MPKKAKPEDKVFRVFLTRHYIASQWVDVKAGTALKAQNKARNAMYQHQPDARSVAVDNGWIPEEPVEVTRPGSYGKGTDSVYPMTEILEGVYAPATDVARKT